MARFAPVCPPQIYRGLQSTIGMGTYHLLLAHDIAARPDEYSDLFRPRFGGLLTKILDNSVIELGNAVDLEMIVNAAKVIRPTTTVLPDILLDGPATIKSCKEAIREWTDAFRTNLLEPSFMYVPQGRTLQEWVWSAEELGGEDTINFWGIPRNLVAQIGSRKDLAKILTAINPTRSIHLLGFSDNLYDDIISAQDENVLGIDSAVPLRAISQKVPVTLTHLCAMPKRGKWWEECLWQPEMADAFVKAQRWFK